RRTTRRARTTRRSSRPLCRTDRMTGTSPVPVVVFALLRAMAEGSILRAFFLPVSSCARGQPPNAPDEAFFGDGMSHAIDPTPISELDRAVDTLSENKARFAGLGIRERIALLKQMADDTYRVAEKQVQSAIRAKSIPSGSNYVAEEWLGGPMTTLRNLRLLQLILDKIAADGGPKVADSAFHDVGGGRIAVDVFPYETVDKLLFGGFTAQIWQQPEVNRSNLHDNMAWTYQGKHDDGGVALVLGAGNVASIGPMDVLYKMFVENQVCVL